jgi:hypothetical protein
MPEIPEIGGMNGCQPWVDSHSSRKLASPAREDCFAAIVRRICNVPQQEFNGSCITLRDAPVSPKAESTTHATRRGRVRRTESDRNGRWFKNLEFVVRQVRAFVPCREFLRIIAPSIGFWARHANFGSAPPQTLERGGHSAK